MDFVGVRVVCCGKMRVAGHIATGYAAVLAEQLRLPAKPNPTAAARHKICMACEYQTWLTKGEYLDYLKQRPLEFIANLDDLSALPPLPKREMRNKTMLFCCLCKCWLPAKVRVKREECPIGKWRPQRG